MSPKSSRNKNTFRQNKLAYIISGVVLLIVFVGGSIYGGGDDGEIKRDTPKETSQFSFSPYTAPADVLQNVVTIGGDAEEKESPKQSGAPLPISLTPPSVITEEPEPVPKKTSEPALTLQEEVVEEDPNGPDISLRAFSNFGAPLEEGENISFSVIVKNNAVENIEGTFFTQLFVDKGANGTRDIAFSRQETGPFFPESEQTKIWKNVWAATPGVHSIEACADVLNEIMESDEKNNCVFLTITIDALADNADLVVTSLNHIPQSPERGETVSFYATIENKGSEHAGVQNISLDIDGGRKSNTSLSRLDAGKDKEIVWKTIWKAESGEHTFEVCADSKNNVLEPDETNNCASGTFSVTG